MKWQEPPAGAKGRQTAKKPIVRELQEHPGRWALVEERTRSSAVSAWKKQGCEAVSRKREDGEGADIYARWPDGKPLPGADPQLVAQRERFEAARAARLGKRTA